MDGALRSNIYKHARLVFCLDRDVGVAYRVFPRSKSNNPIIVKNINNTVLVCAVISTN